MPIEVDFGTELGTVVFPEDYTQEQVFDFVKQNRSQIRQNLIQRRQQEMADETSQLEAAKYRAGEYGTVETALNTLSELPRGALEGIGQTAKAFARTFEAGDPFTETPFEQQQRSATQSPIFKAGQAVQEFGQETYPGLPGVRESIPAQIMGGIGSTVSTLPAAAIAGPAGALTAGIAYGLQAGESALDEADATINRRIAEALANQQYDVAADLQDRREQMKYGAFVATAPIGAVSEGLLGAAPKVAQRFTTGQIGGIGARLAERLVPQSAKFQQKFLGVTGAERVRGAVEAFTTEAAQEGLEQFGGNIAAGAVYDPDRGWLDGVAQAGLIGAASGGIVGGLVGSRRNADLADAAVEAVGGNPANPLPRANATVAGIEDTQQDGEAEITAEDVLKMSRETGVTDQEEVVTPTPTPKATPAPAAPEVDVVRLDQLRLKADAGTINPEELAELTVMHQKMGIPDPVVRKAPAPEPPPTQAAPVDTETGLTPDEQDELDQLITAEDAGLLSEEGAITLAAYRSRLGFPAQPPTPTPSAVQEQGPDEGVLRREEPQPQVEVGLRQVDQGGRPAEVGGAEAEVTPEEVQQVKAEVVPETPVPAPVPAPTPEYTPARINKLFQTLKARATAVGKGLYEIKKLAPGQRAVLRTRFGGLQETDQFLLREKSQVTGNPSDEGFILRDKQEATAGEAPRPAPAPAPVQPTLQYTDADFAAAPSREAAGNMAVTQVRTNPSLPPRPPQIFYTLEAVANRAAKRPYDPKNLTAELIKQAQDSGLLTAAKNPKLTADGQRSLADGKRQSEERKAAQANLSDALRERAVLAWDAANDPQSAAYREKVAERPAPSPAPAPATAPKAERKVSQVRQDAREFDRLAIDVAPDLGLIEDPALLSPVFTGPKPDKMAIQAEIARRKAKATVLRRMIQTLGGDPQKNSEADRAALLPKMRERALEVQQQRKIGAFDAAITAGGPVPINTSNLAVGDKITVGGSDLTITAIDPDTMDATADGGERYGEINLPDGIDINVDAYTPAPAETPAAPAAPAARAPRLGAGQTQGDLIASTQAEPLALVGEEVVDLEARKRRQEEAARAAAEAKAARERAQTTMEFAAPAPDAIESALQKVIEATDPRGKAFEAVTALSYVVLNQAAKIALAIYKRTKSWVAARNAGMDYIKSHVQLKNEAETGNNFEEFIKGLPNQEIPAGTPELPQPPNPSERVESRGLFVGELTADTDENWAAEAKKWVDFYKGNLERAFQVAMTADIDNAFREYVFADLLQRSELEVARAKNDVDLLRALNLQERIAKAEVQLGATTGKAMAARKLSQERYWWLQPALIYRNLIRKRQAEAIPFPGVVSQQVRKWLVDSGREAIDQVTEAMKQADNVFSREFRKIKTVPGAPGEGPIQINWREILTKAIESQGNVRQKMLQVILADPRLRNLSPAGIAEITNLLTNAWEKQRDRIFTSEFRKKVPLPTVKPDNRDKLFRALPRILRYANIARATPGDVVTTDGPETFLLWEQAFRDAVAPEFGVAEINGGTARKLTALAQDAQARKGVNRNEIIQQMFRLMAREGGVNFSDALRDYWYAAVLSGTRTQVDNALNILNGGLNTAMFAGMSGRDAGLIAYSALKGLDEGIRDFWPMLWRGELYRSVNFNPDQPGNALEGLGESRNLFAKGVSQMKYVSRLIQALDHVTALMSDASAKAYALRKEYGPDVARSLMMPAPEVVQAARDRAIAEGTRPELVNKRTREILQEKFPVEILLTSKEIREATTFTEVPQGLMGSVYEGLNSASRKFPALKFITGTNFVRFAANYTNELLNYAAPIAAWRWFQSAPGRSDGPLGLNYSESRRDLLLAKAAIGTALGAFAAALFLGDDDKEEDRNIDITGSFKSLDPNKRKQLLAEGRQPYSIRFGNTYVSYRQLGFGGLLGAIGELRDRQLFSPEKWSKESITDKILDAGAAGMFIVKDSSAISGLTEFLGFANAYKYDTNEVVEKAVPRYLARLGGSLVPNILKEVDAWTDPSIFKAEGGNLGYEYFLQQVPYARREIGPGPILNVLGEPVQIERYPYSRWVTQRQDDKAWDTLGRLASKGVFMPTPAVTVKVTEKGARRELTREEKYEYQRAVGQGYRKFIEQNSERLLKMTPAQASDYIDKNADKIRRTARTNLKNSY